MRKGSKKLKKKNADDPVDMNKEYILDPKYKTELCKSFEETKFCTYGNKCRFAHGKKELFQKTDNIANYKKNECKSFFKDNYCNYGSRCLFKHSYPLSYLDWSFYNSLIVVREGYNITNLAIHEPISDYKFDILLLNKIRLKVFKEITEKEDSNKISNIIIPFNNTENRQNKQHTLINKFFFNKIINTQPAAIKSRSTSCNDTKSSTTEMRSPDERF